MGFYQVRLAEATVGNLEDLQTLWKFHGGPGTLLGRIVFKGKLTEAEFRSLDKDLRALIEFEDEDEDPKVNEPVVFLERLFALEDPRA